MRNRWLGLLIFLAACQAQPIVPTLLPTPTNPPTLSPSPTVTLTPTQFRIPTIAPLNVTIPPAPPTLKITNPVGAYLREAPSADANVVGEAGFGAEFLLTGYTRQANLWYQVEYEGQTAWVMGALAETHTHLAALPYLTLPPTPIIPTSADFAISPDYPLANWVAAHPNNSMPVNRPPQQIDMIVIHTLQGAYQVGIQIFRAPQRRGVQYIVSSTGEITQMIRHQDIARHSGHPETDGRSIGIEHEGFSGEIYSEAMYRASAQLVRFLADEYGIPLDREHIIGHNEVPGCPYSGGGPSCHSDPGSSWDWDYYMELVRTSPAPDAMQQLSFGAELWQGGVRQGDYVLLREAVIYRWTEPISAGNYLNIALEVLNLNPMPVDLVAHIRDLRTGEGRECRLTIPPQTPRTFYSLTIPIEKAWAGVEIELFPASLQVRQTTLTVSAVLREIC